MLTSSYKSKREAVAAGKYLISKVPESVRDLFEPDVFENIGWYMSLNSDSLGVRVCYHFTGRNSRVEFTVYVSECTGENHGVGHPTFFGNVQKADNVVSAVKLAFKVAGDISRARHERIQTASKLFGDRL